MDRRFPEWMYAYPDGRSARIAELEADVVRYAAAERLHLRCDERIEELEKALIETNDLAAQAYVARERIEYHLNIVSAVYRGTLASGCPHCGGSL